MEAKNAELDRSRRPATASSPRGASTPWSSPTGRAGSPCSTPPPSGSSATPRARSLGQPIADPDARPSSGDAHDAASRGRYRATREPRTRRQDGRARRAVARTARSSRSSSRSARSNAAASSSSSARSATRPSGSGCGRCSPSRRSSPRSACSSAGVAHEINNPLAYVGNNLAVLERDLDGVLEMIDLLRAAAAGAGAGRPEPAPADRRAERGARLGLRPREPAADARPDPRGRAAGRQHRLEPARAGADLAPEDGDRSVIADLLESALEMIRGRMRRHNIEVVRSSTADVPPLDLRRRRRSAR